VKNVVSNVSSFNRYRSEKDYEEWVVKERERAARLQASRSERTSERSSYVRYCIGSSAISVFRFCSGNHSFWQRLQLMFIVQQPS